MSETQRNHEEINKLMTNQKFGLLRDKLAELKADTDPQIFQGLSVPNQVACRGFSYQAYEEIVERIVTFFENIVLWNGTQIMQLNGLWMN